MPGTPTPTPGGGTFIEIQGKLVYVEEGPAWLAKLFWGPRWAGAALATVLVVVAVVGVVGLARIDDPDERALAAYESIRVGTVLGCIALATIAADVLLPLGYVAEVGVGVVGGYGLAWLLGERLAMATHDAILEATDG